MAKRKRRKRREPAPAGRPRPARTTATAPKRDRRERKEKAREAREAASKRARRRNLGRRGLTFAVVMLGVFAVLTFLFRASAPNPVSRSALDAAAAAGCGDIQTPAPSAPGGLHLAPGETHTYDETPATSGYHDESPLPDDPHVSTLPIPETKAVHNLEHAFVIVYYRADGPDALPDDVVGGLTSLANAEDMVLMAPYPQLPEATSLALTAWNKLWQCPSGVTPSQATTITRGFIDAYRGTSNAPEAPSRL